MHNEGENNAKDVKLKRNHCCVCIIEIIFVCVMFWRLIGPIEAPLCSCRMGT